MNRNDNHKSNDGNVTINTLVPSHILITIFITIHSQQYTTMFIIELTYKVSIEQVDQHLEAHINYLNEQYTNEVFLASGRKIPRTGGIILSAMDNKAALLAILDQDPFKIHDLADYQVTEFIPSKTIPALAFLKV